MEGRSDGKTRKKNNHQVDDLKEKREYCKLKEDAQDRSLCRTGFGRGCEPVVGQNAK
jgi:hypothetical protein